MIFQKVANSKYHSNWEHFHLHLWKTQAKDRVIGFVKEVIEGGEEHAYNWKKKFCVQDIKVRKV